MPETRFDVIAVGNALVDVIAHVDNAFIERHGLTMGAMTLVDEAQARELYGAMPPTSERSGGSAANTVAGIASLGGTPAFIGKVGTDQLGELYAHDLRSAGVLFQTPPLAGIDTGRSLVAVTPDAQRTMCTFLGAGEYIIPADIDAELIGAAQVTFLEGYLFDRPDAKEAFRTAARAARAAGRKVALTLSDSFCVERHHAEFLDLVANHVDVLFANEAEIITLYGSSSFDEAVERVRGQCHVIALTRSEKGSVAIAKDETYVVPAEPVARVVDTTGAGDQYAAGFLYGLTHGRSLRDCARIGGIAAAEVISHFGPRPETSLAELVVAKLR